MACQKILSVSMLKNTTFPKAAFKEKFPYESMSGGQFINCMGEKCYKMKSTKIVIIW